MRRFVIKSSAPGRTDENRRETSPKTTTAGPESQTIFSTAGTLRSAEMRSCHPVHILCRSAMLNPTLFDGSQRQDRRSRKNAWKLSVGPCFYLLARKMPKPYLKVCPDNFWPEYEAPVHWTFGPDVH